jgi:hypothetical protein
MEHNDETTGSRAAREGEEARDAAAERVEGEHPASAEQGDDEGIAKGFDQEKDTPEEELQPNFARGISNEDLPESQEKRRFSEGIEQTPDAPDENVERRFSEGIERSPTSD